MGHHLGRRLAIVASLIVGLALPSLPAAAADALPKMVPGGAAVLEGDDGTTTIEVPVTLSAPSPDPVTASWATIFGPGIDPPAPATPGSDYTATSGTVTFAPGQTTQTVTIDADGDTTPEPDEWIVVAFAPPTNATLGGYYGLGFGVLTDDDTTAPTIAVAPSGPHQGGDVVTVTGWGWPPGAVVGVCQAADDATITPTYEACFAGSGTIAVTRADALGHISVSLSLDEWGYLSSLGRWSGCAVAPGCEIRAATLGDVDVAATGLPWTVPDPPVRRGAITVTPWTHLVDGQTVTVAGTGFRPDAVIDVYQCLFDTSPLDPRSCDATRRIRLTADSTGAFTTPFVVHPVYPNELRIMAAAEAADWTGTHVQTDISFGDGG